jgi:hypothetical protein
MSGDSEPTGEIIFPEAPRREIVDSDHVEIENVEKGLDITLTADYDGNQTLYNIRLETTPEFDSQRKSYQDEAHITYNQKGRLVAFRSNVFLGHDYREELEAGALKLDPAQIFDIQTALEEDPTGTALLGGEIGKKIMESFVEGSTEYARKSEEPNVELRLKSDNTWSARLLPTSMEVSEGRIQNTHDLGVVIPDYNTSAAVRWFEDDSLDYSIRTLTSPERSAKDLDFVTGLNIPVAHEGGIFNARTERVVTVPSVIPPKRLEGLFDEKDKGYLSIKKWLPVHIKRPL